MKIRLAKLAAKDLKAVKEYISQDKPKAASGIIKRIFDAIENLSHFPNIGRSGRVPHTKELVVSGTPLIIIYKIQHNTLFIVRIIHTSRK